MSVRATGSLIGDVVVTTGIKGPKMVVLTVDEAKRLITTVWFSDDGTSQSAVFPAASLDRAEILAKPVVSGNAKKPGGTGKVGRSAKK
ncbi:MAG: hypothetical protein LBG27_08995 [Spirochaetaceae bacterium]|jgi:hypothetical protein|nr:hypothetical protein [Spirochaetaceae bacterium]